MSRAPTPSQVLLSLADEADRMGRNAWRESDLNLARAQHWLEQAREYRQLAEDQAAVEAASEFVGKDAVAMRRRAG